MKVGIIGSGVVGQTLAAGFVKHGHQVEIGTRDPAKLIPPLHGALLKNEQDVHLFERLAFLHRRERG